MSQGASKTLHTGHLMDVPVTASSLAFFRGVQAGYEAYQQEHTPLSEHEVYERLVYRLLALPDSTSVNTGWVIGWIKGILEGEVSPAMTHDHARSLGRRSEVPTPYGENVSPVIFHGTSDYSVERPFCSDSICPCHRNPYSIAEVAQYVKEGLMTPDEGLVFIQGIEPSEASRQRVGTSIGIHPKDRPSMTDEPAPAKIDGILISADPTFHNGVQSGRSEFLALAFTKHEITAQDAENAFLWALYYPFRPALWRYGYVCGWNEEFYQYAKRKHEEQAQTLTPTRYVRGER